MNNDARFFFCISGFIGFVLFFSLGWLVTGNALDALLRGSVGCLLFAVVGRIALGAVLRSIPVDFSSDALESPPKDGSESVSSLPSEKPVTGSKPTPEELAVQASARATSEAAAGVEPGVNTSV